MYLKTLTLKGFKSFASATTLRLEPGITCVVGPNGSGKSNVVDALAWVMGEQGAKSLRGGKMEDVIFAGTAGRPPLGRAEVSLTIDNTDGALPIDYTEVTITRTMFRGGGSEYAINGTSCRLLDVQELLSDSGLGREMHVIVGQGQLDTVLRATPEERRQRFEEGWQRGGISALSSGFTDFFTSEEANKVAQDFARAKIRSVVRNQDVATLLCPSHHIGTKRTCTDIGYFEAYNRDNVELVDIRSNPLVKITTSGIQLRDRQIDVDTIIFAIGFDAITGALTEIEIRGVGGHLLTDKWAHGPRTYLGIQTAGFPNLFMITGPGSPSVLSNMVVSIEQHVDWITDCLNHLSQNGINRIEASVDAEDQWVQHVAELAADTLYPEANSWYVGANIPGKPRTFMPYVAGCGRYRREAEDVAARGYAGFMLGASSAAKKEVDA